MLASLSTSRFSREHNAVCRPTVIKALRPTSSCCGSYTLDRTKPTSSLSVESEMIRPPLSTLPTRRAAARLLIGFAGLAVVALPRAAQTVVQQGWNPKEVLAKETYVKPPEIVERLVTAPRNNVAF